MVVVLLCGAFLVVMSGNLLTPALPTIMADMGIDTTTVQWLTSGYSLVEAVVTPLSAFFLGKFKTKHLYVSGLGFYIAGSIVAILAPTFPVLLAGRMLQAVAGGIMMPMTITLVMLIFPREKRGAANGIVSLVISFGPAIGPTLGGILVDMIGWNALFEVMLALGIIMFVLGLKFVYEHEEFEGYSLDVPSVALMSCGMVCLLMGISSSTSAANIAVPIAMIAAGLVLLGIFVNRQFKLEEPMLKVDVLRSRRYRVDVVAILFTQAALFGGAVIMPLYVQNVLGYSATVTGLIMLPGSVLGAIVGIFAGRLFDKYGVRVLACTGITITLLAAVGLVSYQIESPIWYVALIYAIIPLGMQAVTPVLNAWGVNSLDNGVIQHANALSGSLNQVAASIGIAFMTALTALSTTVAPGATELEQLYVGDHLAFIGELFLIAMAALIIYVGARDKEGDLAPAMGGGVAADGTVIEAPYALTPEGRRVWTVADAMEPDPVSIRSNQTVGDALDLFISTSTSGVPVVEGDGRVVGYLSDGDLMAYLGDNDVIVDSSSAGFVYSFVDEKGIHENLADLRRIDAMSIATDKVVTLSPSDSLEKACTVLAQSQIKKAPVVQDGRLVGMISRRDVLGYVVENVPASVQGIGKED